MSAPQDLIAYLAPLVTPTEVPGTNLFEGPMPELPNDCVTLTIYGGSPGEYVMGASLQGLYLETVYVQVHVRSTSMSTARTRLKAYYDLLENYNGTIGGIVYHRVSSEDGPGYSLGQDQNARWNYVFNVKVEKARG